MPSLVYVVKLQALPHSSPDRYNMGRIHNTYATPRKRASWDVSKSKYFMRHYLSRGTFAPPPEASLVSFLSRLAHTLGSYAKDPR
ncbi:unnamed protein product [Fusarium venenatum]|uniref:Uncharacterized protein n=1 Tax=Fusarium venenatum TaxID=56646 RepID=A0A2L2T6Q7_9HYPO|nr:uncharacterized protein FVRRES_03004 [Fusarium venenatum]CEI66492.1 unnamed protein product [Fusarium venenatum]